MPSHAIRILLIEDDPNDAALLQRVLLRDDDGRYCFEWVDRLTKGLDRIATEPVDVVLLDLNLPESQGLETFKRLQGNASHVAVVVLTGMEDEALGMEIVREGAQDFVVKDRLNRKALIRILRHAIERKRVQQNALRLQAVANVKNRILQILLTSPEDAVYVNVLNVLLDAFKSKSGFFGLIAEDGSLVSVADFGVGRVFESPEIPGTRRLVPGHPRSLDAPLVHQGQQLGALHVADRQGDYTKDDQELLESIAELIAPVLSARLQRDRQEKERKEAEQARRESEERYRSLCAASPVGILQTDAKGYCTYANERWQQLAGLSLAESQGDGWCRLVHPDDRDDLLSAWSATVSEGKEFEHEYRIITPRGELRWLHVRARPLGNEAGTLQGYVGTAEDITERIQAAERIREQATLLDKAHDAILVRDMHERIVYWNQGATRTYGWAAAEAIGKNADQLLYHDPGAETESARREVLEAGEWTGELRLKTKEGRDITVESHWTLLRDDRGRPKAKLVISNDVTEKKKLEGQMLRNQRLESIGTLAGGIAHDLNNALTPILMAVHILGQRLSDPGSRSLLDALRSSAERGAEMVKQILSFARGMEGDQVLVQPRTILKELESMLCHTMPKSITVRIAAAKDLWPILGDATQLHQMLLNLCVNARDAMPHGGKLTLTAANTILDEQYTRMHPQAKPGPHVVLSVADSGAGMPPGIVDRIFDPFFTTKEQGKGTGLGLSIVMGIVKSHGGFINVYSEVGKGSKFSVYLPASEAEIIEGKVTPDELPEGHGELILIVDDELSICQITRQTLETFGYRVLTAVDGAEAVASYAQHAEDVHAVITDMMMPVMDGPATIRALRKLNPQVRIIAASGLRSEGAALDTLAGTVQGFLTKPYDAAKLLMTLRDVLAINGR